MTTRRVFLGLAANLAAACLAVPVLAQDTDHPDGMHTHNAYARTNGGIGRTGAIFLMIHNNTETADRLLDARSDVAQRVEIHSHKDDGNGVMQMIHLTEGLALPAGEVHLLERGSDHVMLMGLTRDLVEGEVFPLTLVFENAGEMVVDVIVDNARKPGDAGMHEGMDHSTHGSTHGG